MNKKFISHLGLEDRKILCAKVIFLKWFSDNEIELGNNNPGGCTRIKESWIGNCNDEVGKVRNEIILSDFLKELLDNFEGVFIHHFPGKQIYEILDDLKLRGQQIDCKECTTRICDGKSRRDDLICAEGQCLDYFIKLFNWTIGITRDLYERYSLIFPKKSTPSVILCTNSHTKPNGLIPVYISGKVEYIDDPPYGISKVTLLYNTEKLSQLCFFCAPYVLFHECVAHVYKSIEGPSGYKSGANLRIVHEPNSPFDEGWMDYVAYRIVLKVLTEISNSERNCPETINSRNIDKYITGINKFYSYREEQWKTASGNIRWKCFDRIKGIEAARRFERFLKKFPATKNHYLSYFLQTSFDFNLWTFNNEQKDKFTQIIYDLLSAQSLEENPSPEKLTKLRNFIGEFRKYIEGASIDRFFKKLEKIEY